MDWITDLGVFCIAIAMGLVCFIMGMRAARIKLTGNLDNPRCYCPDCGAYLGHFFSHRIRMVGEETGGAR